MTLFFLLMVLCLLVVVALWWNPSKQLPPLPSFAPSPEPSRRFVSARDEVLEEDIEIIASHLRKEEADQRYKRAMERLESIKENG